MRGKLFALIDGVKAGGITPAHAGKTPASRRRCRRCRDHPRACGENLSARRLSLIRRGSPPRMRGKHDFRNHRSRDSGITPAHAGKTAIYAVLKGGQRDHPRACGENFTRMSCTRISTGSPPRMRGKRERLVERHHNHGITPAHAGKTISHTYLDIFARDHPRACGENTSERAYFRG